MNRLTIFGALAVLAVATAPVGTVYPAGAPRIAYVHIQNGLAVRLSGRGVPGTALTVFVRQRHFVEGRLDDASDPFSWCNAPGDGVRFGLGGATVGADGSWTLAGLTLPVVPVAAAPSSCAGGLRTEFLVDSGFGPGVAPEATWLNLRLLNPTSTATVAGAIDGAEQAAIAVAAGPSAGSAYSPVNDAVDGLDLCASGFGCGRHVAWRCDGGGTFACPRLTVADQSAFPGDSEYPFVLGVLTGHRAGGSVLMVTKVPRPVAPGSVAVGAMVGDSEGCASSWIRFLPCGGMPCTPY